MYPAIAVALALKSLSPSAVIEFVGAAGGMECRIVPQHGFRLHALWVGGLQRRLSLKNLLRNALFPLKFIWSQFQARSLIYRYKPDWVVGFGGYASFPAVSAATAAGVPAAIMEQNAWPGLANRRLSPKVEVAFLGAEAAAAKLYAKKMLHTGNPVRPSIGTISREDARLELGFTPDDRVLLVMGGSLGAKALNEAVAAHLESFRALNLRVMWQCGRQYFDQYQALHAPDSGIRVLPYIEDMDTCLAASDLALCRAGALTLAELEKAVLPAVLVPSPNVAEDHQTANARAFASDGGALLLPQAELNEKLPAVLRGLVNDSERMKAMRNALSSRPRIDAALAIAKYLLDNLR